MQMCPYCCKDLIDIGGEFPGDYTLQCPECGGYFEDVKWDGTTAESAEEVAARAMDEWCDRTDSASY